MIKKILAMSIVFLVMAEILARLVITTPSSQTYDPELGWVYIPHTSMLHAREGFARNMINNIGFNDDDLIYDESREYILFLGDSFTEAFHVKRKYNFTSLVDYNNAITVNAGRSALSPAQYTTILSRIKKIFTPDKIVLVLTDGDLYEMIYSPMKIIYDSNEAIARIELISSKSDAVKSLIEPVVQNSAFMTYMMRRLKPIVVDVMGSLNVKDDDFPVKQIDDTGKDSRAMKELLSYIFGVLNQDNNLYVLYIPSILFGIEGALPLSQGTILQNEIISEIAGKHNIPYLNAYSYLDKAFAETGQPPFGFHNSIMGEGHLNIYGHQAVARAAIDILRN